MGDVVQLSEVRRSCRRARDTSEITEPATIVLFTGVRVEHWAEPVADPDETAPRTPRRRRRRE